MTAVRPEIDPQLVYLDPFLLDRARVDLGLSLKQLAVKAEVDYRTVRAVLDREGVYPSKAKDIAHFFNKDVVELLAPWDPRYAPPAELPGPWSSSPEWETEGYLDQGRLAPNGLYYLVCRMRHRHTAGKYGRGKFYHLSWMLPQAREDRRHQLSRHADVCARIGIHRHIVMNMTSTPAERDVGWWVVDDWVGHHTLADHLAAKPWPSEKLPRLLVDVVAGMAALHAANVVFRELAPARILLADQGERAVLTDFELAKLLGGAPSVSSEWPEDPFRAPEVDIGNTTPSADLYSFGQVVAAAIAGPQFDSGKSADIVAAAKLPKRLQSFVMACLEPVFDQRPADVSKLLTELKRWLEQS